MVSRKIDYSNECTHNDDNDQRCWNCTNFVFPIGCMKDEVNTKDGDNNG